MKLESTNPVSYTHLDVYKRQVQVDLQTASMTSCVDFLSLSMCSPNVASGIYTGGDLTGSGLFSTYQILSVHAKRPFYYTHFLVNYRELMNIFVT